MHVGVPNLTIVTDTIDLIRSTWDIDYTGHGDILLSEVLLGVSVSSLLYVKEVPEEDITSLTSRDKAHIIFKPVNCSDLLNMTLALEVWRALVSVEVEHMSSTTTVCSSKQVTTIGEL